MDTLLFIGLIITVGVLTTLIMIKVAEILEDARQRELDEAASKPEDKK